MTTRTNVTLAWLLTIGVALALSGCATTKRDWQEANRQGTVEAYQQFLQNHPDADQAANARRLLAELRAEEDWGKAESINTINGYRDFLSKHPQSKQAKQAREHLVQLESEQDWKGTKSSGTIASYEEFIEKHPRSTQVSEAKLELGRLKAERDWKRAKEKDSLSGYRSFLRKHLKGKFAEEAQSRIDEFIKKEFEQARADNTAVAYRNFLNIQSTGAYADQARDYLEEIKYKTAIMSSDKKLIKFFLIKSFLASYPESKYREEIALRFAEIQQVFTKKVSNGSTAILVMIWRTSPPTDAPGTTTYVEGPGGIYIPLSVAPGENIAGEVIVLKPSPTSVRLGFPKMYDGDGNKLSLSTSFNTRTNQFGFHVPSEHAGQELKLVLSDRKEPFPGITFKINQLPRR